MKRYLHTWKKILRQRRNASQAKVLISQIEFELRQMQTSPAVIGNRYLKTQWEQLIAPGLALYRTLLAEGIQDRQAVLDEVETLFEASFFVTERRLVRLLNLLPNPFPLVRLGLRQLTVNHYLPGASEVIEDSRDCFATNTHRCFILDTLTQYGAPELASLYCKTDDWLAAALPKVRWLRTQTLASGDELCDFRWYRQHKETPV